MATNECLNEIIDAFNNDKYKWLVKISLSEHIDYVSVFNNEYMKNNSQLNWESFKNYFLLKKDSKYVGIIEDRHNDLHVYVKEEYRKKTNLIQELNHTVIPFLLSKKEEQNVTFFNEAVESYFLNALVNIEKTNHLEAVVKKSLIKFTSIIDNKFNEKEFEYFKKIVIKTFQLTNKMPKLIKNNLAMNYLMPQDFISDSEYFVLRPDEKVNFSEEEFDLAKKELNYMKKLKIFYEEILLLKYNSTKVLDFDNYTYDMTLKEIREISLIEFESI